MSIVTFKKKLKKKDFFLKDQNLKRTWRVKQRRVRGRGEMKGKGV
jgi:hypothetical protein